MHEPDNHDACCGALSRRALLTGAATLGAVAATASFNPAQAAGSGAPRPASRMSGAAAFQALQQGNARYVANTPSHRDFSANRISLATGQQPIAVILGCADSRVAPELLFDQAPGDLFVIRVAGNFVNIDGLASIEYAVELLGTPLVVVLGHSSCGAVDAAIKVLKDDIDLPGHLPTLVHPMFRSVTEAQRLNPNDVLGKAIELNARQQSHHMVGMSPILGKYVEAKQLEVVSGVYDIATGAVKFTS